MALKVLVTIGLLALVWVLAFRSGLARAKPSRGPKKKKTKSLDTQDLVKCSACGIYLPSGHTCDCKERA